MCLILLAHRVHPGYPLVFAANRDEFYERPTAAAGWWEDAPEVLAGRDLRAGGTWMGVTREGRWAAVTNYRDLRAEGVERPGARSRGELVSGFLLGDESPAEYLREVGARGEEYAGFNLLAGDLESLGYVSNRQATEPQAKSSPVGEAERHRGGRPRELPGGVYGLSNALLDTPWPKVERGKRGLQSRIEGGGPLTPEVLFEVLYDAEPAPDHTLPDTGVGLELERALSSPFIATPVYGTRSSTVLLIDRQGEVTLVERSFAPGRAGWEEVRYEFRIEGR